MATALRRPGGDGGYFGPGSLAWQIHASRAGIAGGLRALLLQALNPLAMAAVAQHSTFREDPWGRLMATSRYLMDTIYGDTATADRAAARVRAIHRRLSGIDDFTGLAYRADDPELLLWVHCTEVHSFMSGYRHYDSELSVSQRDRYVGEMVKAAELVGLDAGDVPATYEDLTYYLRTQVMVASPAAVDAMRFILSPPVPLPGGRLPDFPGSRILIVPGKAAWAVPAAAAVAILPERARKAYKLPNLRPMLPTLKPALSAFTAAMRRLVPPPSDARDGVRDARLEA
jgi:uncharacterized protein (DUF2236 family)